ncbi:MAG TPA: EpsD family peptidyl-prolyl cis-trans isomerase [Steroidobacteraceae bacterium]|jgi:EpsD family peptidyl-prolyl cis-trans isomerase|nr:EpsD family peptidyl-prolyl cis-trans isomerase [Steroidobacteraceae bacterium]
MVGVLAPFALSACGSREASSARLAARVNDQPIPVQQLRVPQLAQFPLPTVQRPGADADGRLEQLIDLQLLVQQARRLKLERDPAVSARIEAATEGVLAQAYIDRAAARSAAPDARDIAAYYRDHPESFARRRLYLLRELTVRLSAERFAQLRRHSAHARDLTELEQWLQLQGIAFEQAVQARASDQLPREIVPAFLRLRRGDIGVARIPQGAWVLQVLDWVSAPVSLQEARPAIAGYLAQQLRSAVEQAEIQRLRDGAHIEYLGRYAPQHPSALSMVHTMRTVTSHE